MRITNNVLINNLRRNLTNNMRAMDRSQNQLATGKRINKPSDDPAGIVDSLRLTSRISESKQHQENIGDALNWLETTDDALDNLTKILSRVYELTTGAANGPLSNNERQATADEVKQLTSEVENLANTTHGDRYLFGGSNTLQKAYDNGTWNANNDSLAYEIGVGITVPVNITAQEVFQYNDPNKDLMGTLKNVFDHMMNDDITSLGGADLTRLQTNINQVLSCRAQEGARVNRLEMAQDRLKEQEINFTKLESDISGIDPAQVILDMKNQENVYRASLSVGSRVIMPTLVDFLR